MTQEKIDCQREHQANERTFLAWLRTSISLIALGFTIARFSLFLDQVQTHLIQSIPSNHPIFNYNNIGIFLVITGMITIVVAAWSYNQVFWQIEQGNYKPNRLLIWIMTATVIILGMMSLPLFFGQDLSKKTVPNTLKYRSQNNLPFIANVLIGFRY